MFTSILATIDDLEQLGSKKDNLFWRNIAIMYLGNPSTIANEKTAAAKNAALFTKKIPFYFPEVSITRKMHLLGFVISPLIATDKTPNICYKYLKLEQMGDRLHAIWNLLHRTRFFSVRNGNERLRNIFIEYENSFYIKK